MVNTARKVSKYGVKVPRMVRFLFSVMKFLIDSILVLKIT